jgi:type IV pilus assembly protein PilE
MMNRRSGFSLLELTIVIAVIGILAAVAVPSYQHHVHKATRADGHSALLNIQLAQEKWRANHVAYTSELAEKGLGLGSVSAEGAYALTITTATATAFTATARGLGGQAKDTGCAVMTLATGPAGEIREPPDCW